MDFYLNSPPKDLIDIIGALAPAVVGLLSLIVAFISIRFTKASINQQKDQLELQKEQFNKQLELQKEQWLKDAYIKNEADVLLKAKKLLVPVLEATSSLNVTIIRKWGHFVHSLDTPLPIKLPNNWKNKLLAEFNYIKELYNFYVENDNIFIKHNLDKCFNYLNLYLQLLNIVPKNEELEIIEQKGESKNPQTGEIGEVLHYRYAFWYRIIVEANRWNENEVKMENSFVSTVNDDIIKQSEELIDNASKELNYAMEYLTNKTIFEGNRNSSNERRRQKWYLDFEGKLFSNELQEENV